MGVSIQTTTAAEPNKLSMKTVEDARNSGGSISTLGGPSAPAGVEVVSGTAKDAGCLRDGVESYGAGGGSVGSRGAGNNGVERVVRLKPTESGEAELRLKMKAGGGDRGGDGESEHSRRKCGEKR